MFDPTVMKNGTSKEFNLEFNDWFQRWDLGVFCFSFPQAFAAFHTSLCDSLFTWRASFNLTAFGGLKNAWTLGTRVDFTFAISL